MSEDNNDSDVRTKQASGLLPEQVRAALESHWDNSRKLKRMLNGSAPFPLEVPLKPPKGSAAIQNLFHFQSFLSAWRQFAEPLRESGTSGLSVRWQTRNYRSLGAQEIPTHLIIQDIGALAQWLGERQERQLQGWLAKIQYLFDALTIGESNGESWMVPCSEALEQEFLQLCIEHLERLDAFELSDLELLVKLLPQLQKGMGRGGYLRALPVTFVDTKFVENNLRIIESLVAVLIDSRVNAEGLIRWLDCRAKPRDWLLIKPLCEDTASQLGGLPLLRLSSDTLQSFELPAANILVVENEQSCLALNHIPNTIAVSGGGKNVAWLRAEWLTHKRVGYWGDIDSEGLAILSDARNKLSTITPLMMDAETVERFAERMVAEPDSVNKPPISLTDSELELFNGLRAGEYANQRLEQERLPMEYVEQRIRTWIELGG